MKGFTFVMILHSQASCRNRIDRSDLCPICFGAVGPTAQKDCQFGVTGAGTVAPEDVRQQGSNPVRDLVEFQQMLVDDARQSIG
jgi:hypothetical protein